MSESSFPLNAVIPFRVILLKNKVPITNGDGKIAIQRIDDELYFNPNLIFPNQFHHLYLSYIIV